LVFIFPNFLWAKVDLVQVVEKLQYPWAMDFLPGSEALVTEKPGRLQKVNLETGEKTEIQNLPEVHAVGQGGLLDVMVHPDFKQNQKIFLTFSAPTKRFGGCDHNPHQCKTGRTTVIGPENSLSGRSSSSRRTSLWQPGEDGQRRDVVFFRWRKRTDE